MSDILQPFSVAIDFKTGNLSPDPAVLERRLSDMAGYYVQDIEGDELAYSPRSYDQ